MQKLLFFHNALPEYRIAFFQFLQKSVEVKFIILSKGLQKKLYHTEMEYLDIHDMNLTFLDESSLHFREIRKIIQEYSGEVIVLPPLDNFNLLLQALYIEKIAAHKKIIGWCEKWEAPGGSQPFRKKCKNAMHRAAFRLVFHRVDLCIASGTKASEYLTDIIKVRKKVKIAYDSNSVDSVKKQIDIREKFSIPPDWKIVLYYGRIIPRKGLDILIRACGDIMKSEKAALLVCGDGEFRPFCERLAEEMRMNNIRFTGWISPRDRYAYFSQSNVFVLPSRFYGGVSEAWGLTVNESLQCGTPVIATTAVGAAYDLLDGKNGCMVEENNPSALSEAIGAFLCDWSAEIRKLCRETAAKYSVEAMADVFLKNMY